jgi:molybdenum cofactor cytidylyltransferase
MITAVVLAAGASTRMGRNKLLLPLEGEPIVRRTTRRVCDAGFDDVLVVLGRDAASVREALDGLPCRFATNDAYETGMGSSFRVAVEHLGRSDAAMFALADQPFLTTDQFRRLADTYREHRPPVVSVRYGDVTAPPHLFARELFPELSVLQHGAKPVLVRHSDRAVVLDFPAAQLVDIDTPEDYASAQQLASLEP